MFTGIILHVGRVARVAPTRAGRRLCVEVGPIAARLAVGSSLAVDGACLTVARLSGATAEFDVVPETLSRTTLGGLAAGSRVHLEAALAAGAALDGHIVQGHVDGLAEVLRVERSEGGHVLHLAAPPELTDEMAPKGSIALAGVSLTLASLERGRFSVALVPTTLAATTLAEVRISDRLNVELDILGKYVRQYLRQMTGGGLTLEKLRREGFA